MSDKICKTVIDVSTFQGTIDWEKAKSEIDGAIIRATYGTTGIDAQFKRNTAECERLGIPYGVYHFTYADSIEKAEKEVKHLLETIKSKNLQYPVYIDMEDVSLLTGSATLKDIAETFGNAIEAAGYWAGIYSGKSWWTTYLEGIEKYTKWVAQWNHELTYTGANVGMWQFTSTGKISGINGNVDMNLCYLDFPKLIAETALTKETVDTDSLTKCMDELVATMKKYGIIK